MNAEARARWVKWAHQQADGATSYLLIRAKALKGIWLCEVEPAAVGKLVHVILLLLVGIITTIGEEVLIMAHVEKMSIALTPEMAAVVRQCVESGEYASSSEVIREALRDWKLKRALQQNELAELRHLWQTGLESGPGRLTDMDAIKAEARKRLLSQDAEQH
jgi:antitoxin ParD1/3/4